VCSSDLVTLPAGTLQAVRASLRYGGAPSPCPSGGYNDRDDLFFAVAPGQADTTPPAVNLTAPATLQGTVSLQPTVTDDVGVTRVEFYAGATLLGTSTTAPFSFNWQTTRVANGAYRLFARAFDAAGNAGESARVDVTVSNQSCATESELLSNGGFEGATGWTTSAQVISVASGSNTPRTGRSNAWLDGYGRNHIDYAYQQVAVPASACTATLSFYVKISTRETGATAADTLTVTVRNTSNTVLATLGTFSNLDRTTGYVLKTFDLSAFKGQTVRVHFEGVENASAATDFFLDDTSVKVTRP
jgi:hypothetical protein